MKFRGKELVQKLAREGTPPQAIVPVRGVRPNWSWLACRRIEFSDELHNKMFWMVVHLTHPARRDKMVEMMLKLHVKNRTLTADSLRAG